MTFGLMTHSPFVPVFAWLPPELTAAVLTLLPVDELGRMNRVAHMFS